MPGHPRQQQWVGDLGTDLSCAAHERAPPLRWHLPFVIQTRADPQRVREQNVRKLPVALGPRLDEAKIDELLDVLSLSPGAAGPGVAIAGTVGAALFVKDRDDALAEVPAP